MENSISTTVAKNIRQSINTLEFSIPWTVNPFSVFETANTTPGPLKFSFKNENKLGIRPRFPNFSAEDSSEIEN